MPNNEKYMQGPVVVTHRVPGEVETYSDETIDFATLTFRQQRELAREQWDIRNEMRRNKRGWPAPEEEFNEDTVIDELRSGVFED